MPSRFGGELAYSAVELRLGGSAWQRLRGGERSGTCTGGRLVADVGGRIGSISRIGHVSQTPQNATSRRPTKRTKHLRQQGNSRKGIKSMDRHGQRSAR